MFGRFRANQEEELRLEKERLNKMSEKELLIEMILELKRIDQKCDDIARKIVIWSNWIIEADEKSKEISSAVLYGKDSCRQGVKYGLQ